MKKSLLSLLAITLVSAGFAGLANAQQLYISELFSDGKAIQADAFSKVLNEYDNTRWYSNSSNLVCEGTDSITITSPVIEDTYLERAKIYRLFLSPYRIDQLKNGDASVDTWKIIIKETTIDDSASDVKFVISSADVDSNTAYYGFVLPIDIYDGVWIPSKETCFQLANNICLQDAACDTLDAILNPTVSSTEWTEWGEHGAASDCVGMKMANVTHTVNGDTITLKWTAVDGDVVQIAIFNPQEEVYKSLWAVSMKDEKFDYKMQWEGEQNFRLTNGCGDLNYKADAKETPEKIVTPATGPAENVLYIAIAAIILYGAYVVFFRKSENN